MWLPIVLILSLFGVGKTIITKADTEPRKEYSAMTDGEKRAEIRWQSYQNQEWYANAKNQFEAVPVQKP